KTILKNKSKMDINKWETVKEMAERKSVTTNTVYRWLKKGKLDYKPDSKKLLVKEKEFVRNIKRDIHVPSFKTYINKDKAVLYADGGYKKLYINFDREFTVMKDGRTILKTTNEDASVTLYNNI